MKTTYKYYDLPDGMVNIVSPTRMQAMMSGAYMARQRKSGRVELTYTDNTTESAMLDYDILGEQNWFKIVDDVQTIARATA